MRSFRIITLLLFTLMILSPCSIFARPVISGISENIINIDSGFNGKDILIFGSRREVGDIVVVIRGPKKDFLVTKKDKLLGVWYNGDRVEFKSTPSFYKILSTSYNDNRSQDLNWLLRKLEIGKNRLSPATEEEVPEKQYNEFYLQLTKNFEKKELYSPHSENIDFLDESLFKARISFPKNISRGTYTVEVYLIDDNSLISFQTLPIYVYQVGFSAKVFDFAHDQSFFYGLLAVLIALTFGWFVNYVFAKFFGK